MNRKVAVLSFLHHMNFLPHIIDIVSFEMVSATLCEHTIATSFSHRLHSFIHFTVGVDHEALSKVRLLLSRGPLAANHHFVPPLHLDRFLPDYGNVEESFA